jgi:signal transduction histidine kinase
MASSAASPFPTTALEAGELLPDGVITAGRDAVVRYMNAPAERITGVSRDVVVGRDIREALRFQDSNGAAWWELTDPWSGLRTRTGHREKLLLLPNGNEVLLTARYLRSGRSAPVDSVVLALRDAEARRRAEADHAALISTISHELRSPLTGVKGFSSTLLRRWDRFTDAQKRLMLETIEADADRVTRLITELLDVSRIDSGRLRIHAQPLDSRTMLNRFVDRYVATGVEPDRFTVDVSDGASEVWADPDRFDQIVANLIDNALKHGRGHVGLSAFPSARGVVVGVADDGPGIPVGPRELVSRFWHGKNPGSTGLGLYIVRGLVEAHGGVVAVDEAPGGGALITVAFPRPVEAAAG